MCRMTLGLLTLLLISPLTGVSAQSKTVAERLGYPPGKAQRARLLGRLDALLATSGEVAKAAALRFPGTYELVPLGVDLERHAGGKKRRLVVLEWSPGERSVLRALTGELGDWELVLLRTRPLTGRPPSPRALRGRLRVRTGFDGEARAEEQQGSLWNRSSPAAWERPTSRSPTPVRASPRRAAAI